MKIFNTVISIVLIIAVAFLFWEFYNQDTPASRPRTDKDVAERLEGQDFSGVRIAYINTDSLVEKYDYHKELRDNLEKDAIALEQDLARKSQVFQENIAMLQEQADQMSEEELQAAQLDLQQSQQRLMTYRDEKAQELSQKEQELNRLIKDDMDEILDNIRQEFELDFILSYDPGSILLEANENYNITDIVAERLNKKYQQKATGTEAAKEEN